MLGDVPESASVDPVSSELRRRWAALAGDAGLGPGAAALGEELIGRYGEAHRRYHDRRHLLEVLRAVDEIAGAAGASTSTRLAAWFHDAVYQGRAGDDERASADLAARALREHDADVALVGSVAAMVAATARHLVPGEGSEVDGDTALLLDADLAVLASDRVRYDEYVAGVRAEHSDIDDDAFRSGRLRALQTLVERERLFHTEVARDRFDSRARENLRREIAALSSGADGG